LAQFGQATRCWCLHVKSPISPMTVYHPESIRVAMPRQPLASVSSLLLHQLPPCDAHLTSAMSQRCPKSSHRLRVTPSVTSNPALSRRHLALSQHRTTSFYIIHLDFPFASGFSGGTGPLHASHGRQTSSGGRHCFKG